jgi:hypothetical protein
MAKRKTAGGVARVSTAPTPAGVPVAAPMRPVEPDETETTRVKASDPHRVGIDHTHTKLRREHKRPKGIVAQIAATKQQAKGA